MMAHPRASKRTKKKVFYGSLEGLESNKKNNSEFDRLIEQSTIASKAMQSVVPNHAFSHYFPFTCVDPPSRATFLQSRDQDFIRIYAPPERMPRSQTFAVCFSVFTENNLDVEPDIKKLKGEVWKLRELSKHAEEFVPESLLLLWYKNRHHHPDPKFVSYMERHFMPLSEVNCL